MHMTTVAKFVAEAMRNRMDRLAEEVIRALEPAHPACVDIRLKELVRAIALVFVRAIEAGAVENAGEFGVSLVRDVWEASLRVRYLGKYPLIEDNSVRADAETGVNLRAAWKPGSFTVYAEALNIFDQDGKDIVYFYGANVAGLDPPGEQVDGRVSRVEEPRTFRVGVKYAF